MGNYLERNISRASSDDEITKISDEVNPSKMLNGTDDDDDAMGENINYHIYSYKQQMQNKEQQILKWAMAKLALTDELIRANVQRNYPKDDNYETDGYLTDDEMDEEADQELSNLENYRTKLINIIVLLKRNNLRKKGKRSKRRKDLGKLTNKINTVGLKRSASM